MIVVDSTVWVDYFNGNPTPESDRLDDYLGSRPVAIGDLILAEVLQGFRHEHDARRAEDLLTGLTVFDMLGAARAVGAAERYRSLKRIGITIRKTADVLIASFCIDESHQLLARDRDFDPFTEHLGLRRA
ncbi:PIN domain nuclease [Gordonia sp. X0973]|uniref:type II toxin-antitoxin system VapC family toxin n=1 Tax=Gordonia sp. X0973 TaxID=2742602 RepID=UPI000F520E7D|nr:PIN domain nuclease [Gordonia sp. X0973]QKT08079.1 PIN domain nuclease [Gordonia sp. X0973]